MSKLNHTVTNEFQDVVKEHEYYNKNILAQLAKLQEVSTKLNKNVIRACTTCGCIKINVNKDLYCYDVDMDLDRIRSIHDNQINGCLCEDCEDLVIKNIGSCLYYLASICNAFDLDLEYVFKKEIDKLNLLGKFNIE